MTAQVAATADRARPPGPAPRLPGLDRLGRGDHPAFRRPPVVRRSTIVALAIGGFGQAYALLLLGLSWAEYPDPRPVAGLWALLTVATFAAPAIAVRRGGVVPGVAIVPVVAVIGLVDVAVPALAGDVDSVGPAAWNWGAVALTFLVLAIYRPAAEVLTLVALHVAGALVWPLVDGFPNDPVRVTLAACGAALPALAATAFLRFYLGVLADRERAALAERETRARQAAEDAVARDWGARIARVRADALPLLRDVAGGGPLPLDDVTAARARRISDRLRRELVGGREVDWLLRAQVADQGEGGGGGTDVEVVTGLGASQLMTDETRVALGALVSLLRRHDGWSRLTLTVAGAPDRTLMLALVAHGPAAAAAAGDDAVLAALRPLTATGALDDPQTLVIQARLEAPA
jgi:hypothetical protein